MLALFPPDHRREDLNPASLRKRKDLIHDLVNALLPDLTTAFGAVRHADPRPEKAQIVIDLRHCTHGGTGILGRGLLVNGDGRREAVDIIHIGFIHLTKKHSGIGAQAFHITSLPFGIDRIEGKTGFAAAGKAGDNDQFIPGNGKIDILQIVLSGAFDGNEFLHAVLLAAANNGSR